MKRLMAAIAVAVLVPSAASAGTKADPEVTDPRGDAYYVSAGGTNADWADITAVWFDTLNDDSGIPTHLRVHLATVGDTSAPDHDAMLHVSWALQAGQSSSCWSRLLIVLTDDAPMELKPSTTLTYTCDDDENYFELPVLGVQLPAREQYRRQLTASGSGAETIVTIPLAAFDQGRTKGLYRPGAVLNYPNASSNVLATALHGMVGLPGDHTGGFCFKGPVAIGCQSMMRPYTIGS
ncbi:MAG TPA: hypothetical protein VNE62_06310 [Actinomycetota bacterium]|nr:hypothetical protein [Actinomycetota bacterium]